VSDVVEALFNCGERILVTISNTGAFGAPFWLGVIVLGHFGDLAAFAKSLAKRLHLRLDRTVNIAGQIFRQMVCQAVDVCQELQVFDIVSVENRVSEQRIFWGD
jgi:hypothetical protein